eukprot:Awhi_evm2s11733
MDSFATQASSSCISLNTKSNITPNTSNLSTQKEGFVFSDNNYFIVYHCEELQETDTRSEADQPFGSIETFMLCVTNHGLYILARDGHRILLTINFADVIKITITPKTAEKHRSGIKDPNRKGFTTPTTVLHYHEYHCRCHYGVVVFDMLQSNTLTNLLRKENISIVNKV